MCRCRPPGRVGAPAIPVHGQVGQGLQQAVAKGERLHREAAGGRAGCLLHQGQAVALAGNLLHIAEKEAQPCACPAAAAEATASKTAGAAGPMGVAFPASLTMPLETAARDCQNRRPGCRRAHEDPVPEPLRG
jgi:hypothetical protein